MAADKAQTQFHTAAAAAAAACSEGTPMQLMDLPKALLEVILIQGTSLEDKKAIRLTCKSFVHILDGSLMSTRIIQYDTKQLQGLKQFLQRMSDVPHFKKMCLVPYFGVHGLSASFPSQLTKVTIYANDVSLHELRRLRCLTALSIGTVQNFRQDLSGLEYFSGLTKFCSSRPCGSLAPLAPTLKHLSIGDYIFNVKDVDKLTSLAILELGKLPYGFFRTHGHLPLRHVGLTHIGYSGPLYLYKGQAWDAAPKTLTCLTVRGDWGVLQDEGITAGVLPDRVTCLQLYEMKCDSIDEASRAHPGLINLDICLHWGEIGKLTDLSKFRELQSLRLHISGDPRQHDKVLAAAAAAVAKGVKLEVMPDTTHILGLNDEVRSIWAT